MAQHHLLNEKDEPKLFKSLQRLTTYLTRPYVWSGIPPNQWHHVMCKEIFTHKNDTSVGRVVSVRYYTLQDKTWDERRTGGYDLRKDVAVDVHFTRQGKIVAVYYPV